jgi:small subunit ribosomal protein S3
MGQKVNPVGIRLGITRDWTSTWYANKRNFPVYVYQDWLVRGFLKKKLSEASVSRINIERAARKANITIHTARPGVVIGKKGQEIELLRKELAKRCGGEVHLNIVEVRKPELDAKLVAENIAQQLQRRVTFRRAMKRAVQAAMRLGAQGIRVRCGGRLGGAEIARSEWYREGRVPLHTLRANIDYGSATAHTPYGTCGVKVWVFRGEIMEHDPTAYDRRMAETTGPSRPDRGERGDRGDRGERAGRGDAAA